MRPRQTLDPDILDRIFSVVFRACNPPGNPCKASWYSENRLMSTKGEDPLLIRWLYNAAIQRSHTSGLHGVNSQGEKVERRGVSRIRDFPSPGLRARVPEGPGGPAHARSRNRPRRFFQVPPAHSNPRPWAPLAYPTTTLQASKGLFAAILGVRGIVPAATEGFLKCRRRIPSGASSCTFSLSSTHGD